MTDCSDCGPEAVLEDDRGHPLPFPTVDTHTLNEIVAWTLERVRTGEIRPEDFGAGLLTLDDVRAVVKMDDSQVGLLHLLECLVAHKQGWSEVV